MKVNLEGVAETMLIPLCAKAVETKRKNSRFIDEKAVELVNKIDYDFSKFDKRFTREGVIARSIIFDKVMKKFISQHPNAICISVGCGLDARFYRMDNGTIHWYNVDFPEVIKIRKQLLKEDGRIKNIAGSALDKKWAETITVFEKNLNGQRIAIILEGILMYFTEQDVRELFSIIKSYFPGCTIFAELMHPFVAKRSQNHETVKNTSAVFHWGIKKGIEAEALCDGLHFMKEWSLFVELKKYNWMAKVSSVIPGIKDKNNRVAVYNMSPKN